MSTISQVRRAAVAHVEGVMYDDVVAEVVGMTDVQRGTRVGLHVEQSGMSVVGALLGGLLGLLLGVVVSLALVFVAPPLIVPVVAVCGAGGGYLGATEIKSTDYATVVVDDHGQVVQENRDCSEADFNRALDREAAAGAQATYERSSARHRARRQEELAGKVAERVLFGSGDDGDDTGGDPSYSTPNKCPRCGHSGSLFSSGFSELSHGQYQCDDCGHIVDLRPGE